MYNGKIENYDHKNIHHRIFMRYACFRDMTESDRRHLYIAHYMGWLTKSLKSAYDRVDPPKKKKYLPYKTDPLYEPSRTGLGNTMEELRR